MIFKALISQVQKLHLVETLFEDLLYCKIYCTRIPNCNIKGKANLVMINTTLLKKSAFFRVK